MTHHRVRWQRVESARGAGRDCLDARFICGLRVYSTGRQAMRWAKIEDVGDTEVLTDEQVDQFLAPGALP
jgi:hypothetical protein